VAAPRRITGADLGWILDLNQENQAHLSPLTPDRLAFLIEIAAHARVMDEEAAFLLAFDRDAPYDSPNFVWFRERYERFIYVDRVVVSPAHRGTGCARNLYEDLFDVARASEQDLIACEVNLVPPNPGSDAFHQAIGFAEAGRATVGSKAVRYLTRSPVSAG